MDPGRGIFVKILPAILSGGTNVQYYARVDFLKLLQTWLMFRVFVISKISR